MHNSNKPYTAPGEKALCHTCYGANHSCTIANDNMFTCQWYITLQDIRKLEQKQKDLVAMIKTRAGARIYIDKINEHVFDPQPFTGNSTTHYNLGERGVVMSELRILLEVLDLDTYTDLIIYLHNIINKGDNDARRN